MCDPLSKAECIPAFTRESERGPFVREVEKRNERRSEIELLLIVRGTENREMYVYKSVAEQKGFRWQHKTVLWPREGRPLFRPVSRCVRFFSESRVCTHFHW